MGFVLTSIYYAYYYAILALMNGGRVPTVMQSVTLGLFEQQYIRKALKRSKPSNRRSRTSLPSATPTTNRTACCAA